MAKQEKLLWRQGDLIIQQCHVLPDQIKRRRGNLLAQGDTSGHTHSIAERQSARIFESLDQHEKRVGTLYLDVYADQAVIVHPEHGPITLTKGFYKIWRQREFTNFGMYRMVSD